MNPEQVAERNRDKLASVTNWDDRTQVLIEMLQFPEDLKTVLRRLEHSIRVHTRFEQIHGYHAVKDSASPPVCNHRNTTHFADGWEWCGDCGALGNSTTKSWRWLLPSMHRPPTYGRSDLHSSPEALP